MENPKRGSRASYIIKVRGRYSCETRRRATQRYQSLPTFTKWRTLEKCPDLETAKFQIHNKYRKDASRNEDFAIFYRSKRVY